MGGNSRLSANQTNVLLVQHGGTDSPEYLEYNGYGGTVGRGLTAAYHNDSAARPDKCAGVVCVEPENCVAWASYPNACCPVCEQVACGDCSVLLCPPGMHLEVLPYECCSVCLFDTDENRVCEQGRAAFAHFRNELMDEVSAPCSKNADCIAHEYHHPCGTECGAPILRTAADALAPLDSYTDPACHSCQQRDVECRSHPPECVGGKCSVRPW